MAWKMSIALDRPQVPSMGHHDPLDGWVTALALLAASPPGSQPALERAAAALAEIAARTRWATDDALGLGGLLADAWRVAQLEARGAVADATLLPHLLDEARRSFAAFSAESLRLPADHRLPFRELGLAIGLQALGRLVRWSAEPPAASPALRSRVAALERWWPLAAEIVAVWRDPANQTGPTWRDHLDINEVMLATSLVPDGYLTVGTPGAVTGSSPPGG